MPELFEPTSINGMKLANRFVRSGTNTRMATQDGFMTPKLSELIANVARGGAALVVPDSTPVLENGIAHNQQIGMYRDQFVPGLAGMIDAVHVAGSKVAVQLIHGGAHSDPHLTGTPPMGPSAMPATAGKLSPFPGCREMTRTDIDNVVEGFRLATIRARKAGFDAIQLHCAHGYLLSQFLSPFYNRRTDEYGGSVANRARIIVEAYTQVRKEAGAGYPILVKMNVTDFLDGGLTADDAVEAARIFATMGIDAIELSGGTGWGLYGLGDFNLTPMRLIKQEAYYRDIAKRMKAAVSVPIILTGGIRSYYTAEQLVGDGVADYIGLCRPLIREPGLINRWKSGDTRGSACASDNGCVLVMGHGEDMRCTKLEQN